jgi:hypothetical protein
MRIFERLWKFRNLRLNSHFKLKILLINHDKKT